MQISILDLFKGWGDTESIVAGASVTSALFGIYYIYRQRKTVFFHWTEVPQAVLTAAFARTLLGAVFGTLISAPWVQMPQGLDLFTAFVVALVAPPALLQLIDMLKDPARQSSKLKTVKSRTYGRTLGRVVDRYRGYRQTRAPSPTPDLHSHPLSTQVFMYEGARADLFEYLEALSEARTPLSPVLVTDIMSKVPDVPDLPRLEAETAKLKRRKAALESLNVVELKEELIDALTALREEREAHAETRKERDAERSPPRRALLGATGVIAGWLGRAIINFLLTGVWTW